MTSTKGLLIIAGLLASCVLTLAALGPYQAEINDGQWKAVACDEYRCMQWGAFPRYADCQRHMALMPQPPGTAFACARRK